MAGGAPFPVEVKRELMLSIEDIEQAGSAKLAPVIRGYSIFGFTIYQKTDL